MARGGAFDLELVKAEPPDEQWIKVEVDIEEHDLLQHPHIPKTDSSVNLKNETLPDTRQAAPELKNKEESESASSGEGCNIQAEVEISVEHPVCIAWKKRLERVPAPVYKAIKMHDEKLIECVRLHPALYVYAHPKYLDKKHKNYLWRKIAVELSLPENDWIFCKNRWTNIRDQYKKNMKCQNTVTGRTAKKVKRYKFHEHLQFLSGDEDRASSSFVEFNQNVPFSAYDSNEHSPPVSANLMDINQRTSDDILTNPTISANSLDESLTTNDQAESPPEQPIETETIQRSKKKRPAARAVSATVIKYIRDNRTKTLVEHPMEAFLMGLAPTLKSFSPYYQHVAKGQIFNVIHNLELQQLTEKSSPSTPIISSSPSPSSPSVLLPSQQSQEQLSTLETRHYNSQDEATNN